MAASAVDYRLTPTDEFAARRTADALRTDCAGLPALEARVDAWNRYARTVAVCLPNSRRISFLRIHAIERFDQPDLRGMSREQALDAMDAAYANTARVVGYEVQVVLSSGERVRRVARKYAARAGVRACADHGRRGRVTPRRRGAGRPGVRRRRSAGSSRGDDPGPDSDDDPPRRRRVARDRRRR